MKVILPPCECIFCGKHISETDLYQKNWEDEPICLECYKDLVDASRDEQWPSTEEQQVTLESFFLF